MRVDVYPFRKGVGYGNIMWKGEFPMRNGRFPKEHPVGGDVKESGGMQLGTGENIKKFRLRGYWASCFPEGDGITWQPMSGQTDSQCLTDIRECFGWDAHWGRGVKVES